MVSQFSLSTATVRNIKNAFSDKTIKMKVDQNVANDMLVDGLGVQWAAELLQDAVQAEKVLSNKYLYWYIAWKHG